MASLVDKIVADTGYDRCIVSALVALSFPLRSVIIGFLNTSKASLLAAKSSLVGAAAVADVLSQQIGVIQAAGLAALAPFDTILGAIPFEQLGANCPLLLTELQQVVDNTPTEIPASFATIALGIDGFDIFAGVKDYKTLKSKMNELAFRLQRATSASAKAQDESAKIDRSLADINKYLDIFSRMQ